jgi:hypothetical protein
MMHLGYVCLQQWLTKPDELIDLRNFVADICCFVLLTPLTAVSAWLCVAGALHYSSVSGINGGWESAALILLSIFLVVVYIIWCLASVNINFLFTRYFVSLLERRRGGSTIMNTFIRPRAENIKYRIKNYKTKVRDQSYANTQTIKILANKLAWPPMAAMRVYSDTGIIWRIIWPPSANLRRFICGKTPGW